MSHLYPGLPVHALSIKQPWAWLIVNGHKDIENRDWATKFRGPVAIHTGQKPDPDAEYALTCHDGPRHPVNGEPFAVETGQKFLSNDGLFDTFSAPAWHGQLSGIVGVADIVDCVNSSESDWFQGKFGFVLRNARPVNFIPCKGKLGFFEWRETLAVRS